MQVHANGRVHNNFCEVNHGSFGHGDEVALAVVVHSFDEALQLQDLGWIATGDRESEREREKERKRRGVRKVECSGAE